MATFTSSKCVRSTVLFSAMSALLAGCPCTNPNPPPPPCVAPELDIDRSLVVHQDPASNPAFVAAFSLEKTLTAIAADGTTPTTPQALLQTMLASFAAPSFDHPASGNPLPVSDRPGEENLTAAALLDSATGMVPVGLFNRLDLAPADGSDCGEYRIVYAKRSGPGRFFIIFESKLPNPVPGSGVAGCQPVAKFWADLSGNADASDRLTKLEQFYYTGLPGTQFKAVVKLANYGMPFGQVRTNLFVTPLWALREHRTAEDLSGRAIFEVDTVKESPVGQLYHTNRPPGFTDAQQRAYWEHFLGQPVCNLVRPDRVIPGATPFDVVNGIGGGFDAIWDDFESISQGDGDNPSENTHADLGAKVDARLAQIGVTNISSKQLLTRAGAVTCGGCHQFSSGDDLGGGGSNVWPADAGFVHITENGALSQALTAAFLPKRRDILKRFVCDPTPEPQPEAPCPPLPGAVAAAATPEAAPRRAQGPVDAELLQRLSEERPAAPFRDFDRVRAEFAESVERAGGRRTPEVSAARKAVQEAVRRARAEDGAKEGAFVPVRRVH